MENAKLVIIVVSLIILVGYFIFIYVILCKFKKLRKEHKLEIERIDNSYSLLKKELEDIENDISPF